MNMALYKILFNCTVLDKCPTCNAELFTIRIKDLRVTCFNINCEDTTIYLDGRAIYEI